MRTVNNSIIFPFLVLLISLAATYYIWYYANITRENEIHSYFEYRSRDVNTRIEQRIISYQQILRSARGLFDASDNVSRKAFRSFFNSLNLYENYPGIQGVGYSLIVPQEQIKKHISDIRAEGFLKYSLWPDGKRKTYTSIVYLEPFKDLNLRAFGYDMFSEPVRHKAMELSRDSNKAAVSGKVMLVQEIGKEFQAGFLIYLPVYKNGLTQTTLAEKRNNIIGWVYSPFRMDDFMAGLFGERAEDLDVEIFDGNKISNETKMYDSKIHTNNLLQYLVFKKAINFEGHEWTVIIKSTPKLESRVGADTTKIILIVGLSLSFLLTIITWQVENKRKQTFISNAERERVKKELLEQKIFFEQMFTQSSVSTQILDKDGWCERVNPKLSQIFGVKPEHIEGKVYNIFKDEAIKQGGVLPNLEKVFKEGKTAEWEVYFDIGIASESQNIQVQEKRNVWYYNWSYPIFDEQGKLSHVIIQHNDITERKNAEASLIRSETRYRRLFETAKDGILILDAETGKIVDVNPFVLEMLGYSYDELFGKELWEIGTFKNIAASKEAFLELQNKGYIRFEDMPFETKDGRNIEVEFVSNVYVVDDKEVIQCNIRDITQRKLAEDNIKESEENFRSMFENNSAALAIIEADTTISMVNEEYCKLSGYSKQEVIGMSWIDQIPPGDLERLKEYNRRRLMNVNDAPDKYEFTFYKKNGEIKHALMSVTVLRNKKIITSFVDITERKQAEEEIRLKNEQLLKLNTEKDKFFSIIAHDLKSPFNGFLNLTELMADSKEKFTQEEFIKYSKSLNEAARHLYKLLDNLLEWAQVQKGSIIYSPGKADIYKLVSQCINTINQRALQKKIKIKNEVSISQKIYADEKMLSTVLRNLLSNAVKFTRKDGEVVVKSKRLDNGTLEISVADNGVGIPEKDINKLFKIEEKISTKGTEGEPSTGLGLLLCKEFIEMHGGKIWVESKENVGSTFSFTLSGENTHET